MKEWCEKMTIEKLDEFLKTLKAGAKRIERMREYVRRLEENNSPSAARVRESYEAECEKYFRLEDRFNEVIDEFLNDEEKDLIVSHYILGKTFLVISIEKFCSERSVYYLLSEIKSKILAHL